MSGVASDSNYLSEQASSIKSTNQQGLSSVNITSVSYSSTTNIPRKEPMYIEQLLKSSKDLMEKLNKEIDNIVKVGDQFKTMDNFLANQATSLGFSLESKPIEVTELKEYTPTPLADLLSKEVPIVKGYNDTVTSPSTGGSSSWGPSYSPVTQTTTEQPQTPGTQEENPEGGSETDTKPEGGEEFHEEYVEPTEPGENEPTHEDTGEDTPETKIDTQTQTQQPVYVSPQTTSYISTPSEPSTPSTTPSKVEEPVVPDIINIEEPDLEISTDDSIIGNEFNDEIPPIDPGLNSQEDILDIDTSTNIEGEKVKSKSSGSAAGLVVGVGLAAGAAAAGYGIYKKKTNENNSNSDYDYEEDYEDDYEETTGGEE